MGSPFCISYSLYGRCLIADVNLAPQYPDGRLDGYEKGHGPVFAAMRRGTGEYLFGTVLFVRFQLFHCPVIVTCRCAYKIRAESASANPFVNTL